MAIASARGHRATPAPKPATGQGGDFDPLALFAPLQLAAAGQRLSQRQRPAGAAVLAEPRRLRHPRDASIRRSTRLQRRGDDHLHQQQPGHARRAVAAAGPEHLPRRFARGRWRCHRGASESTDGMRIAAVEVEAGGKRAAARITSSTTPACASTCRSRWPAAARLKLHVALRTTPSPALRRPHRGDAEQERRDLRHRAVVSAHGGVRRPARLGHAALPRPRVLPRIRRLRLRGDRAVRTCWSPGPARWSTATRC